MFAVEPKFFYKRILFPKQKKNHVWFLWYVPITMISNLPATQLFVQLLVQVDKDITKALHYWPFVLGIYQ